MISKNVRMDAIRRLIVAALMPFLLLGDKWSTSRLSIWSYAF